MLPEFGCAMMIHLSQPSSIGILLLLGMPPSCSGFVLMAHLERLSSFGSYIPKRRKLFQNQIGCFKRRSLTCMARLTDRIKATQVNSPHLNSYQPAVSGSLQPNLTPLPQLLVRGNPPSSLRLLEPPLPLHYSSTLWSHKPHSLCHPPLHLILVSTETDPLHVFLSFLESPYCCSAPWLDRLIRNPKCSGG